MERHSQLEERQETPAHTAGAYGFSRNELRALVTVCVLVGGWAIVQWFERRSSNQVPPWVVENVRIDPPGTADSPLNRPRNSRSEKSHVADVLDGEDPGHVLVDINTAGRRELIRLPGIGTALATRIIDDREKNGPFANLKDFERVRGIGPKTANMLIGWVRFSRPDSTVTDSSGETP